jgi:hypothetical protein
MKLRKRLILELGIILKTKIRNRWEHAFIQFVYRSNFYFEKIFMVIEANIN